MDMFYEVEDGRSHTFNYVWPTSLLFSMASRFSERKEALGRERRWRDRHQGPTGVLLLPARQGLE